MVWTSSLSDTLVFFRQSGPSFFVFSDGERPARNPISRESKHDDRADNHTRGMWSHERRLSPQIQRPVTISKIADKSATRRRVDFFIGFIIGNREYLSISILVKSTNLTYKLLGIPFLTVFSMIHKLVLSIGIMSLVGAQVFGLDTSSSAIVSGNSSYTNDSPSASGGMSQKCAVSISRWLPQNRHRLLRTVEIYRIIRSVVRCWYSD